MMKAGFFGIGCIGMKTETNYGSLFRTAHIFGADFLFIIGSRMRRQPSDTCKSWRNIPTYSFADFKDFNEHRPYDCQLVGIELTPTAIPLKSFYHPKRAIYLLGAEDNGLTNEAIEACQSIVILPGEMSLNVSVAGSIVIYDRIVKGEKS